MRGAWWWVKYWRRQLWYMMHPKTAVPGWWDFDVDCGFSRDWYRCGKCDECKWDSNKEEVS